MIHDAALVRAVSAVDPRPASAVSAGCGLAGLIGLFAWIAVARYWGMDGPYAALVDIVACGLPMVLWSVLVDQVHHNPTTGLDLDRPKPWRETIDLSLTKLAGLWLTWLGIALVYGTCRFYWTNQWGGFPFAMWCFGMAAPVLFVGSLLYIPWIDRRLEQPKDGCYALGAWAMGLDEPIDHAALANHLRCWAVKGFFLAFMLAVVPAGFANFVRGDLSVILRDPVALANWLIGFMFVIDCAFATVGYILTFRLLDSHIRSANPFAQSWLAALICYPPFTLMADNGPLDYHPGTHGSDGWSIWFAGHPILLVVIGGVLVGLTAVYAWATVAFGFRFSNLTHRGILTHGPYAFSRHPAYLSKNLFWWISTIPFLTTGSFVDAARATILLGVVSGVYYWRAKTEERHLGADPAYRTYSAWMARNSLIPRLLARLSGTRQTQPRGGVSNCAR